MGVATNTGGFEASFLQGLHGLTLIHMAERFDAFKTGFTDGLELFQDRSFKADRIVHHRLFNWPLFVGVSRERSCDERRRKPGQSRGRAGLFQKVTACNECSHTRSALIQILFSRPRPSARWAATRSIPSCQEPASPANRASVPKQSPDLCRQPCGP